MPGLTGRMETLFERYCPGRGQLAVAYMADGVHPERLSRGGVEYYAVRGDLRVGVTAEEWEKSRAALLDVIRAFRPDVIQCFGSEWPYGQIAESTDVPVAIHMMGFLNVYYLSLRMVQGFSRKAPWSAAPGPSAAPWPSIGTFSAGRPGTKASCGTTPPPPAISTSRK